MRCLIPTLLLALLIPNSATPQVPAPGSRIRATYWVAEPTTGTAGPVTTVGTLLGFAADTFTLKPDHPDAQVERVSLAAIGRMDVSTGRRSLRLQATVIGGLAGALLGTILTVPHRDCSANGSGGNWDRRWYDDPDLGPMMACRDSEGHVLIGASAGGVLGVLVGYLAGSRVTAEDWKRVVLPEPTGY